MFPRFVLSLLLVLGALMPSAALADVRFEGTWPDELVTLEVTGRTRAEAVRALAEKAGWSLVARELGSAPVEVDVQDQPAKKVLETLLSGADFVVTRDGTLVTVAPLAQATALPSAPPLPSAAPTTSAGALPNAGTPAARFGGAVPRKPEVQNEDLVVTDYVRIGPDDVVTDVIVWRGRLEVAGKVTGDIGAFGSDVVLLPGARVSGDSVSFGGSLTIQNGAEVGGDVAPLFAEFERGDQVRVRCSTCQDKSQEPAETFFDRLFERLTGVSLFWLFGALVLAVAPLRTERVKKQLTLRPLRCLGFGLLSLLGLVLLLATLAITLIGIPLAIFVALGAVLSGYVGFCIVLFAAGSLLVGERSNSQYLKLAVGCAAFFVTQWIPGVDGIACIVGLLGALGALVLSRGGGLFGAPTEDA